MALLALLQDGETIHPLVLLPVLALVSVIGYILFRVVYNLFFNPLRKFPGPKLWAISNIPYTRMFLSGEGHFKILQLHQQYGPIVRIGPKDLSINHPDGMKDLRGHRKGGTGENSKDPVIAQFNHDNIIGADRQNHSRFRRIVAHGFSHQSMLDQQPIIKGYIDKFINGLREVCENGTKPVNIAAWYNFATFDIIGDLAFGEPFGCLDNRELHPWIALIFDGIKDGAYLGCLARMGWLGKVITALAPKGSDSKWAAHVNMARDKVRKRLDTKKERPDFIDAMLKRTGASGNVSDAAMVDSSLLNDTD
jgi:cytochrome P450